MDGPLFEQPYTAQRAKIELQCARGVYPFNIWPGNHKLTRREMLLHSSLTRSVKSDLAVQRIAVWISDCV